MSNIINVARERGEFVTMEDGFMYYWPEACRGALSSAELRVIADHLDDVNRAWQNQIEEEFSKAKGQGV